MTIIYGVGVGAYSDYHVTGLFSKREVAEKYAQMQSGEVEEYELDKSVSKTQMHKRGFTVKRLSMRRNGDAALSGYAIDVDEDREYIFTRGEYTLECVHDAPGGRHHLWVTAYVRDDEQLIKIANDKRREMIANNEWPEERQ